MTKPLTRPKRAPQTQRQHRGVALAFGISTLAFAIVIAYFALASTTITITTKSQPVTVVFPLTVQAAPTADTPDTIQGAFATTTEAAQATADSLKSTQTVDAKATGTVTITNTWSQAQPLAATTRLLSSGGVLFRLDAFVSVPAHGTADVKVTADTAGASGDIGPSHFTIPGLSTELQAKIYGDSAAAMAGGTISQAAVTADDIEALRKSLDDKLTEQAQQTLTQKLTEQSKAAASDTIRFFAKPSTETFSAAVGDPASSLTGSATALVVGVALNTDDLYGVIVTKLLAQLPEGETIIGFSENNFTMTLDTYDEEKQTLTLNVTANGMSTADLTHASFAKSKLTNKSRSEIVSYLSGLSIVDSVTVAFRPFWVTRTPVLTDHINLVVTNP